jgi:hypothetical protein
MHCCHHWSKTHGMRGLLSHHRNGGSWRMWWDVTRSGRQNRPVQACHVASHCIHPCRVWVMQRTWVTARHAGVGVADISALHMAVVPIFKRLEQGGWLQWALAARKSSGLLIQLWGWIFLAAGWRSTQRTTAAMLLLLQHVDSGGGCCPSTMQYCCIACNCHCIDAIAVP